MKMFKTLAITAALTLGTLSAQAGQVKVGTGGETGNYYGMSVDIVDYCGDTLGMDRRGNANTLEVMTSGGSVVNVDGLINKKFFVAWSQEDVLQYQAKRNPAVNQNRLKIVASMHPETIHVLIPKNWQPTKAAKSMWGKMKFWDKGDKGPVTIDINMLKGQTVGAWGGSVISAKALGYFLDENPTDNTPFFNVQEYDGKPDALDKPFIIVGGAPYAPVENYLSSGRYHIVGLNHGMIASKAPFYLKTSATYQGQNVDTVAVRSHLIGKSFNKESRNTVMTSLASCINDNLADLADDPNTNPNWQAVYDLDQEGAATNWSYFKF